MKKKLTKKQIERLWNRIFPFKVGDRIKVVMKSDCVEKELVCLANGRTGVVEMVTYGSPYPIKIRFDEKRIQEESSHVFKEDELIKIKKEEKDE